MYLNSIVFCKRLSAIIFCCLFLCACNNNKTRNKNLNKNKLNVEEAVNIKLNYTLGGKVKAILSSALMLNIQDQIPYVVFPNKLHVDFYNQAGIIESKLDANYAKYEQNQSKIFLKDSVILFNVEKGDTLYCNELYWDRNKTSTEFYTEKPVRIRTKTETIDGKGMEASQDFKNWRILHSIGIISVPASKFPG